MESLLDDLGLLTAAGRLRRQRTESAISCPTLRGVERFVLKASCWWVPDQLLSCALRGGGFAPLRNKLLASSHRAAQAFSCPSAISSGIFSPPIPIPAANRDSRSNTRLQLLLPPAPPVRQQGRSVSRPARGSAPPGEHQRQGQSRTGRL